MKYVSTRGDAATLGFGDVILEGLARDGGLYVPESVPQLPDLDASLSYGDVATAVMQPFADDADLASIVADAYATFDHPEVCPVVELGDGLSVQELWHGPTLAFKDIALQLVGRLMDAELARRGDRRTIVVATSGDTGSAAIAACVGRPALEIVVLHPAGRTSEVQRRQMTTVDEPNVHNVAIEGTFDDCQDLLKDLFADVSFRDDVRLGAMNSINWARVLGQIPYYVTAARAVGGRPTICVPTGNFGNILAGWYAREMGTPIERLLIASNSNDILTRWAGGGALAAEQVVSTLSPSMDIQVSSNHERLLFELLERDGAATGELQRRFRDLGSVEAPAAPDVFAAARIDDDETLAEIRRVWDDHGYLIDPHTAVGIGAARRLRRHGEQIVCLSTAHPAKFPDAVEQATGVRPAIPPVLAAALERPERYEVLGADVRLVQEFIRSAVKG
ncbi:MAG: threonine synthase [Acidimicrobiales bacterium]